MTVNDFRRSFDGRSIANGGLQPVLKKTEGAASNGYIAETATTLTADDILVLADGPAGSLKGTALGRTSPLWVTPRRSGIGATLSLPCVAAKDRLPRAP
jgi:hypothetical protein